MASSSVSLVDCLHRSPLLSSYIAEMKADYYRYIAEFEDKGAELAEVASSLVQNSLVILLLIWAGLGGDQVHV